MIRLPEPLTPTRLADWIELSVVFGGENRLSKSDLYDILDDAPDADEPSESFDRFDWARGSKAAETSLRESVEQLDAEGQSATENLVAAAWQELAERAHQLADGYPLVVKRSNVAVRAPEESRIVYSFLMLLGARLTYSIPQHQIPVQRAAVLFERVVARALENLVGGKAVRFGWPQREDGLPPNFREASVALARLLHEELGPHLTVSADEKDHGLDVIAWKPFADQGRSQLVVLCQCAIGNDWTAKPLHIVLWRDIVYLAAAPINAVAFVDTLSNHSPSPVMGTSMVSGVLIDRLRLASLVTDVHLSGEFRNELASWNVTMSQVLPMDV